MQESPDGHNGIIPAGMNILRWSKALLVISLLTGCQTYKSPVNGGYKPKMEEKSAFSLQNLQECAAELTESVMQSVENDVGLQSLHYIKISLARRLSENGFENAIIGTRIHPLEKNSGGLYNYLTITVYGKDGSTEIEIGHPEEQTALGILQNMLDNFEDSVQKASLEAFKNCIKENTEFDIEMIHSAVHGELSRVSKTFLQHGFVYKGVTLGKNPTTNTTIINISVFDTTNEAEITIPVDTETILEIKPQQKRPSRDDQEEEDDEDIESRIA